MMAYLKELWANAKVRAAVIALVVAMVGTFSGLAISSSGSSASSGATKSLAKPCRAPHQVALACPAPGATTTTTVGSTTTTTTPPGAFPNASNTGVPPGAVLTTYTGPTTITSCGTVVNNAIIPNGITITATNGTTDPTTPCVTIQNSRISGVLFTGFGGTGPTIVQHSEIIGTPGSTTPPLWQWNFWAYYVNEHGGRGQMDCDGPCGVFNSFVHDEDYAGATHMQAYETNGDFGGPVTLQHNTFDCNPAGTASGGGGCAGDVSFFGDNSQISNTVVDNNLFVASAGQFGYCLYSGAFEASKAFTTGANIHITNNVFQKGTSGHCGDSGPVADWQNGNGNVWSGNAYDDGTAINE